MARIFHEQLKGGGYRQTIYHEQYRIVQNSNNQSQAVGRENALVIENGQEAKLTGNPGLYTQLKKGLLL